MGLRRFPVTSLLLIVRLFYKWVFFLVVAIGAAVTVVSGQRFNDMLASDHSIDWALKLFQRETGIFGVPFSAL